MAACKGRHHKWNAAGTACAKCGAPKRKRGRPPGPAPAKTAAPRAPRATGDVAARLAATLGPAQPLDGPEGAAPDAASATQQPAAAPPTPSPPPDVVAPPPPSTGWCKRAGKLGTKGFVGLVDLILEKGARRIANDPDEDDVDEFASAFGQQLAIWFPDTALTPAKTMILAGGSIVVGMCYGSEKMPPPPPKLKGLESKPNGETAPVGATAADMSTGETSPPS